ncbi:MAG TPA: hypothetical protein VL101_02800 [Nordella sp.]|nr:hypothetical protein [Nordella sp.]
MNGRAISLSLFILCGAIPAHSATDDSVLIGPWKIEASFTNAQKKFDRCMMSRTVENGVVATFARDTAGTTLTMTSERWKLDDGKNYPVEYVAGKTIWKADVTATPDTVRVVLTDDRFNKALRNANRVEVRGAGATIKIPLEKSAAALARLESCYDNNRNASETNPFETPKP